MAKIAIHQPRASYILGGAETVSIQMAKILSQNHEVSFITSKSETTEIFQSFYRDYSNKIKFFFIESPLVYEFKDQGKLTAFDFESLAFGENSSAFYETNQFDVIVSHYSTDLITLNKKKALVILHLHGYPKEKRIIDEVSYSKADFFINCSQFTLKKNLEYFPNLKNNYFFHIRPDLEDFAPSNEKKDIDLLFVGRLIERKGIHILVKALKLIESEFDNCVIAGGGQEEGKIKALITELNLGEKIKCIGPVERSKTINLMGRSKIFVHPTTSREPFPTTLIEAMSIGTPIISTTVGGIPEMINNGVNGILVEPNNELELSKAIVNLLKDKELYTKLRSEGLNRIKKDFNKEKKDKEFLELYKNILGGRK